MKLLERKREREEKQNKCLSVCLRLPTTRARMMNGWILSHVQRPLLDPGGYTHTQVQTHRPSSGVIPHWPHALQLPTLGTESIHCRHQKILLPQIRKGKWRQMTSCRPFPLNSLLSPTYHLRKVKKVDASSHLRISPGSCCVTERGEEEI